MFWNVGQRDNGEAIGQLCREYDVDVLLLAEAGTISARLVTEINDATGSDRTLWELPRRESRVRAFTRYAPTFLKPAFDSGHVKMLDLQLPNGLPLLIVAAHLPSKRHADDSDQQYRIRQLRTDITTQETLRGHQNTVVIGDLNVNPFEDALTAADGLHGVMDKTDAVRAARTVQGRAWDYFYNPMWSRLGDESAGPPGTYRYAGSGLVSHFWHTFDQVLLRPSLLPYYDPAGLLVPAQIGERSILHLAGAPQGLSDHLPVVMTLSVEREMSDG
ncbi:MAG: endonuclease/exonuclease/phosphatase family protein [Acetobacteraceae bacterium]|nr:endonuclease/exonuclease/phosphatase family protein [Acetobacteraceae bacterium]